MNYSTFLLDFDHTLFDSDTSEHKAFAETMFTAGIADPDRYKAIYQRINSELWASVERGEITPQYVRTHRFERLVAEAGLVADPEQMADAFVSGLGEHGKLYQGAMEVIEQLSKRVSLAMITNGFSEVQRARIHRLGIADYFDAVVISSEVGAVKPSAEIFDITLSKLKSPEKDTVLMVGDNLSSDIDGGSNYGLATCWFNPSGKTERSSIEVSHEIADLSELLDFVAR